jgi:Fe2+ or Zn2+ uptake regulation protein
MSGAPHIPSADLRDVFHEHGLRHTRQRERVFAALRGTTAHPTAEELFNWVRPTEPGLSLATVYNALEAFTEAGLCRRIPSDGGNGPCRYDADVSDHVHVTTRDGRVIDVPPELGEQIVRVLTPEAVALLERLAGGPVSRLSIELRGLDPGSR